MLAQRSTLRMAGVAAVLAVCVALPGMIWAKAQSPEKRPGHPVQNMAGPARIVNDRMQAFPRWTRTERCEVPPVGNTKFPGPNRFVSVLNGAAFCDRETGLVWETAPAGHSFDWAGAINHCATREVGARKGWALPLRGQLASLVDTNSGFCTGGGLCVPDGHPFQNLQAAGYWSASTTGGVPTFAWIVNFFFGSVVVSQLDGNGLAWCTQVSQSVGRESPDALE